MDVGSCMILDGSAPPLGNRKPMDIGQLDHSWWWPGQITPVCQKFRGQHWPQLLGGLTWLMNDHYTKQFTPFEILCSKVSLESIEFHLNPISIHPGSSWIPEVSDFSETCVTWVADSREHDGTHQAKGQDGVGSLPSAVESDLCARGKEFDGIWSLYHRSNDVAKLNIKSSSWEFRSVGVWLQECTPYRAPRLSSGLWTWRTPKIRGTPSQRSQSWSSSFRATIGHPKCST